MNKREEVAEYIEDDCRYLGDWADEAIIGYDDFGRVVYDGERLIEIYMIDTGGDRFDAIEMIDNEIRWFRNDGLDPIIFWEL